MRGVVTRLDIDVDTLARVGEALGDPTRRAVLAHLLAGPRYPAELADAVGISRSGMSNHLACLRGCGFVTATYEGRRVRYSLSDPAIADALTALADLPLGRCPKDAKS